MGEGMSRACATPSLFLMFQLLVVFVGCVGGLACFWFFSLRFPPAPPSPFLFCFCCCRSCPSLGWPFVFLAPPGPLFAYCCGSPCGCKTAGRRSPWKERETW